MRGDNEGQARVGRHSAEELLQRLNTTGRRADAYDQERVSIGHVDFWLHMERFYCAPYLCS